MDNQTFQKLVLEKLSTLSEQITDVKIELLKEIKKEAKARKKADQKIQSTLDVAIRQLDAYAVKTRKMISKTPILNDSI